MCEHLSSLISLLKDFLSHHMGLQTPLSPQSERLGAEAVINLLNTTWMPWGSNLATQRPLFDIAGDVSVLAKSLQASTSLGSHLLTASK